MTLAILLVAGLAISLLTTIAYYTNRPQLVNLFPVVCEDDQCHAIIFDKNGQLFFNIPNGAWGVVYFLVLIAGELSGMSLYLFWLTIVPFISSIYLSYQIIAVHKVFCKICLTSHLINFALFSHYLSI